MKEPDEETRFCATTYELRAHFVKEPDKVTHFFNKPEIRAYFVKEPVEETRFSDTTCERRAHFVKEPDEVTHVINKPEPHAHFVKEPDEETRFSNATEMPTPINPESYKAALETDKALKELRTELDRAARSIDEQRTTGAPRVNGRHIPPGV